MTTTNPQVPRAFTNDDFAANEPCLELRRAETESLLRQARLWSGLPGTFRRRSLNG
jgi:hypothetical protein